jgi:FixJ family two-component response regulator
MKVVFISGYADVHLSRHGDLNARSWFLQKPVRPTAVLGMVRAALEEGGRTAVA